MRITRNLRITARMAGRTLRHTIAGTVMHTRQIASRASKKLAVMARRSTMPPALRRLVREEMPQAITQVIEENRMQSQRIKTRQGTFELKSIQWSPNTNQRTDTFVFYQKMPKGTKSKPAEVRFIIEPSKNGQRIRVNGNDLKFDQRLPQEIETKLKALIQKEALKIAIQNARAKMKAKK